LETYDNHPAPTQAPRDRIATGCSVTLKTLGETGEWTVTIVSSLDADPEVGDVIAIDVPVGQVRCRVVSVSHALANGLKQR
jgi:transcription elongation GreA/GreB family factor